MLLGVVESVVGVVEAIEEGEVEEEREERELPKSFLLMRKIKEDFLGASVVKGDEGEGVGAVVVAGDGEGGMVREGNTILENRILVPSTLTSPDSPPDAAVVAVGPLSLVETCFALED